MALLWSRQGNSCAATNANVGGHAILCKQSVPRAERPSCARLPIAFPSVTPAPRRSGEFKIRPQDEVGILNPLLAAAELQIRLNGETCHVIATYALLRSKEASPPTLPLGDPSPLGRLGGVSGGASVSYFK